MGAERFGRSIKLQKNQDRAPTDIRTEKSKQSENKARKHISRGDKPKINAILKHLRACNHSLLTFFSLFNSFSLN